MIVVVAVAWLFLPNHLSGQNSLSDLEFFIDNDSEADMIDVKLFSDWKLLAKSKRQEDPEYQPATMTFYFSGSDSVEVDVRIKPRGIFRKSHCLFPPFWVNFDEEDFSNSSVNKYDKLKLVTHCRESDSYKQQMIIEYYAYKMYEIISDYSFRTRLIKINYADTVNKKSPGANYAFFLEDLDQIAERNESEAIESSSMHPERLNRDITTVMDIFQYMIGNTDWSVVTGHNIKLVKPNDPTQYNPIGIPYDFDYCGLVNASYAVPPLDLDIESVTDRVYRGFCRTDEEFQKAFDMIASHEEEILDLFRNSELLDKRRKAQAVSYLEESFEIIKNPSLAKREIKSMCRK